jgi:hypothetical protein
MDLILAVGDGGRHSSQKQRVGVDCLCLVLITSAFGIASTSFISDQGQLKIVKWDGWVDRAQSHGEEIARSSGSFGACSKIRLSCTLHPSKASMFHSPSRDQLSVLSSHIVKSSEPQVCEIAAATSQGYTSA